MIEAVASLNRAAQGQVVRADDIGPPQRDEKGALHGPRADSLDGGLIAGEWICSDMAALADRLS